MSCCDGCIKYLLFFFNLVFSLSGLALVVVGALLLSNTASFADLVSDTSSGLKTPQIFIIVVGVIIFFIATLGCCGAIRENRCMLITFAVLLLSIFIIQLAIGIYALTHKNEFRNAMTTGLSKEFEKMKYDTKVRELFEGMEKRMECCGVRGPSDYIGSVVPGSCCQDKNDCKTMPFIYWQKGCAQALSDFAGKAGEVLGAVAITLSLVEVLGAIFALRLSSKYR